MVRNFIDHSTIYIDIDIKCHVMYLMLSKQTNWDTIRQYDLIKIGNKLNIIDF